MQDTEASTARRPRLVYLLYCGDLNGTERMALATAKALSPLYEDVVVVAPPGPLAPVAGTCARMQVFHNRLELLRTLSACCRGVNEVDFLSASVPHAMAALALAAVSGRRGHHLHVVHGGGADVARGVRNKHWLNWLPVRVIAVSPFIAGALTESGVRRRKVDVIENFVDDKPESEFDASRASVAKPQLRYRVAVVSRIVPMKRLDLLISAARSGGLDDVRIDVYGDGPALSACRAASADLPNLVFHGFEANIASRLVGADALVHTCPAEAFGLVVLEAFAARVPVVVPDRGGTAGIVVDGVNGRLFKADDVSSLCSVLREVLEMPAQRRRALVDAAAADLVTRYSRRRAASRYAQVLGFGSDAASVLDAAAVERHADHAMHG